MSSDNKWISVKERLPEIGVPVLVHAPYQEFIGITVGALYQPWDKRRKPYWQWLAYWIAEDNGYIYPASGEPICPGSEYVTHWMPLPEAPAEFRHGHWEEENKRPNSSQFICSACGKLAYYIQPNRDKTWKKRCPYKYCPNCGAKMDGERSEI